MGGASWTMLPTHRSNCPFQFNQYSKPKIATPKISITSNHFSIIHRQQPSPNTQNNSIFNQSIIKKFHKNNEISTPFTDFFFHFLFKNASNYSNSNLWVKTQKVK
jgi:hypothetical protein